MKCFNYDIVCQEIPDEVTLAINISGCPNRCPGCHSPWLWEDKGVELTPEFLRLLINKYSADITCICFMGGDQEPGEINTLASFVKENFKALKTCWYSGCDKLSREISLKNFDYVKTGPYIESLGGLRSEGTNQRFYKVLSDGSLERIVFTPKNAF